MNEIPEEDFDNAVGAWGGEEWSSKEAKQGLRCRSERTPDTLSTTQACSRPLRPSPPLANKGS